jgi:SAM-dependent methyltransferase
MEFEKYATDMINNSRIIVSKSFIHGHGVEIGGGDRPLTLFNGAVSDQIDTLNGDDLKSYFDNSISISTKQINVMDMNLFYKDLDFVIAMHVIEHLQNPIKFMEVIHDILISDGILVLAVPMKEHCADVDRNLTPWTHLIQDYDSDGKATLSSHTREFFEFVVPKTKELGHKLLGPWVEYSKIISKSNDINDAAKALAQVENLDIHFHVWNEDSFMDFIHNMQTRIKFKILLQHFVFNELIVVLKKQ